MASASRSEEWSSNSENYYYPRYMLYVSPDKSDFLKSPDVSLDQAVIAAMDSSVLSMLDFIL